MTKKWTPATEVVEIKTPKESNSDLIAAWLKKNKPTVFGMGELTPKEDQGGYGFGRGRKPKNKVLPEQEEIRTIDTPDTE